jgi:hypothetical protein
MFATERHRHGNESRLELVVARPDGRALHHLRRDSLPRSRGGLVAIAIWIGAFAIVFGALMTAFAFKLRAWVRGRSSDLPQGARTA